MDRELTNSSSEPRRQPSRLRNIAIGMVLGSLAAIGGILAVMATRGERLPGITFEFSTRRRPKWAASGPADYDLDIQQTGINTGAIHVEVRNREVTAMTLNGNPTRQHLWERLVGAGAVWRDPADVEVACRT